MLLELSSARLSPLPDYNIHTQEPAFHLAGAWHTVGTQACCRSWLGEQGTNDGGGAREVGRRKCRTLTVNSEREDPGLWLEGLQRGRQGFTTGFL